MPLPRLSGSGVEKILISSHEISEDQILYFFVISCCPSEPCIGFFVECHFLHFFTVTVRVPRPYAWTYVMVACIP